MAARKSPAWSEADYAAAGMGRLNLRLPLAILQKLRELGATENQGKKDILQQMILSEYRKHFPGKIQ